jgi:hypothetical protein
MEFSAAEFCGALVPYFPAQGGFRLGRKTAYSLLVYMVKIVLLKRSFGHINTITDWPP